MDEVPRGRASSKQRSGPRAAEKLDSVAMKEIRASKCREMDRAKREDALSWELRAKR
jgi:hypothetical protein